MPHPRLAFALTTVLTAAITLTLAHDLGWWYAKLVLAGETGRSFLHGEYTQWKGRGRTPQEAVLFQKSQIAANCFGRYVQFGREFRDLDLAQLTGQGDDLMLPLVSIQIGTSPSINRRLFVTPEKLVAPITN